MSWEDGVKGIANLMEGFGLSTMDFYENGNPEDGLLPEKEPVQLGESDIFVMSTMDPPPGLPWTLRPEPRGPAGHPPARFHLLTEDGNEIGLVKEPLAKWLTEKAQLAMMEEA